MVLMRKDEVVGLIKIGCGYNQWHFQPENAKSKWGDLSEQGFATMQRLLDDINRNVQR